MKTAIFLNTFAKMKNYDLEELSNYDVRKVAIVAEDQYEKFSDYYGKHFSDIYSSKNLSNNGLEDIKYGFEKQIIKREASPANEENIRIICLSEDNLLIAAQLRDEFNIPGMKYNQALHFRNKVIMKDLLRKNNVRTPRYCYFESLKKEIGLPLVLKPVDQLGGFGISIINSVNEFENFCANKQKKLSYEVEEFISGTLFHCDSIRQSGKILFSVCCEYTNPNFDFQIGKSVISMPLNDDNPLNQAISKFNETVLDILELRDGIGHHEIFLTDNNELVFLEIAARSPGALATPMYRRAFNIGLEDIDFKIQMDIPFQLSLTYETHYLSGIFPLFSGTVDKLVSPELKSKYEMSWFAKTGTVVTASKSLRDQSATIIAWNKDYNTLLHDFNLLRDFQSIQVK
jgi:hypothetical protein